MNEIDDELKNLERHSPSMRFSKGVVERVKLETDIIKEERNPIAWVPKTLIFASVFVTGLIMFLLSGQEISVDFAPFQGLTNILTIGLVSCGGLILFLGIDRWLKGLLIKESKRS